MSFGSRVVLFAVAAVAGLVVLQGDPFGPPAGDLTRAALRQFDGGDAAAAELARADAAKNWTALLLPAGLVVLAGLLFWDDAERLLSRRVRPDGPQETEGN